MLLNGHTVLILNGEINKTQEMPFLRSVFCICKQLSFDGYCIIRILSNFILRKIFMEFQPGDVVRLKSGGPKMTISSVSTRAKLGAQTIQCEWFTQLAQGFELKSGSFAVHTVQLVQNPGEKSRPGGSPNPGSMSTKADDPSQNKIDI